MFTSQELWALSSLKSNISLAAQLECLGRRCVPHHCMKAEGPNLSDKGLRLRVQN